ncbi:DUF5801 repeats-in-toxin domain-containing protein [Legionella erythra]|uniref:Structural toxin protein RtxA n=1 Tax=Legionella erythra TaxID=448 RepID=A0A0W0TEU4_LEGER|nr:DUF5801 repeats-in-toxin domain-containing protein [Legionella erythra]KTC94111.1 structural toxin protein RtxA [Legionella erythra]
MVVQTASGVVQGLEGILIKHSGNGQNELVRLGTPFHEGDTLVLLSGNAYIHLLTEDFPTALSLNQPLHIDGISPLLKTGTSESLIGDIIDEALAKGIDPAFILEALAETAAGQELLGEGGHFFILDPMYGLGAVTAGYPTIGVGFDSMGREDYVTLFDADDLISDVGIPGLPPGGELPPPFVIAATPVVVDETAGLQTVVQGWQSNTPSSAISDVQLKAADGHSAVWDSQTATLTATDGTWAIIVHPPGAGVGITLEFKQLIPVQHANANDPNDFITVPVIMTATREADGAKASCDFTVTIFDDGPRIVGTGEQDILRLNVDESFIPTQGAVDTADFALAFANHFDFGMDNTAAHPGHLVYSLGLESNQAGSGLYTVDNQAPQGKGIEIQLVDNQGVIRGMANGLEYFTISVDAVTGVVTFTQNLSVWHGDTLNPNDLSSLITEQVNDLFIRATAIDGDGDAVSDIIGLGNGIFSINDDGPTISIDAMQTVPQLAVDETQLAVSASASADYSPIFDINPGEDGLGQVDYSLSVNTANGTGSGLYAVDSSQPQGRGDEIRLEQLNANTVEGKLNGELYFTIAIDSQTGVVTFTQYINVWHADTSNPDDASTLNAAIGSLAVVATVTDADGDQAQSTVDVSQGFFAIDDDGPRLTNQSDTAQVVNEDALPQGNADAVQTLTVSGSLDSLVDFGADHASGFELNANFADILEGMGLTSNGEPLSYTSFQAGTETSLEALNPGGETLFNFTFDQATGHYTFNLMGPLDHPSPPVATDDDTQSLAINLGAVLNAVDGDGDSVSLDGRFAINVQDDLPIAVNDCAPVTEPVANLNIYYVVDVSGSMGEPIVTDEGLTTRLALARDALVNLTNQYADYNGTVIITIVPFASGSNNSGAFATEKFDILNGELDDALNFISGLDVSENPIPGSATEYNDALNVTRGLLESDIAVTSPISDYQHVVYFLSDGVPNPPNAGAPASWQSFVDNNDINVIPVGIGQFNPGPLAAVGNSGDEIIQVLDPTDLDATLQQQLNNAVTGNVLANDAFGGDGPHDQRIISITLDNQTYHVDDPGVVNNELTVFDALGGELTFNFATGDYTYIAANVNQDEQIQIGYTIQDADGDQDNAILTIKIDNVEPPEVTLLTKTIEFTRTEQGQQPYGDAEVAEYLLLQALGREGQVVNVPVNGVDLTNTLIEIPTPVQVKFISEGAGHQNMVGYYLYDAAGNIIANSAGLIWLDASAVVTSGVGGTNLIENTVNAFGLNQSDTFNIPTIPAGQGIGFFLIEDGADLDRNGVNNVNAVTIKNLVTSQGITSIDNLNNQVSIDNGRVKVGNTELIGNVYFSHDKSLNTDAASFPAGHALSGVTFDQQDPALLAYTGLLIVGFEDLQNGGDRDYNDIIFSVDLGANIQNLTTGSAAIVESVSDADSAFLSKAVVSSSDFIAGDAINLVSTADVVFNMGLGQVTITYGGDDYVLQFEDFGTGNNYAYVFTALNPTQLVPVGAYELMLKTLTFTPVASEASEGVVRHVQVSVTDDTGLVDTSVTQFGVQINDTLPINLIEFNAQGHFDFGAGNDVVLIPDTMDGLGKVSGNQGIDTVQFNQNGMQVSAQEINAHFDTGWETVDMTGQGQNTISLTLDSVLALSSGSELNLELNDGTQVSVLQIKADGGAAADTINLHSADVEDVSNLLTAPAPGEQLFKLTNAAATQEAYVHIVSPTQELPQVNVTEGG